MAERNLNLYTGYEHSVGVCGLVGYGYHDKIGSIIRRTGADNNTLNKLSECDLFDGKSASSLINSASSKVIFLFNKDVVLQIVADDTVDESELTQFLTGLIDELVSLSVVTTLDHLVDSKMYDVISRSYVSTVNMGNKRLAPVACLSNDMPLSVVHYRLMDSDMLREAWSACEEQYPTVDSEVERYMETTILKYPVMFNRRHIGYNGKTSGAHSLAFLAAANAAFLIENYENVNLHSTGEFIVGDVDDFVMEVYDDEVKDDVREQSEVSGPNTHESDDIGKGSGSTPLLDGFASYAKGKEGI